MMIYVDGDNSPGARTEGIEMLSERDTVKIFYALNSTFYSNEKNAEGLKENCRCKLEFIPVNPGNNAVDFAIVIQAVRDKEAGDITDALCMVSGDKHFRIVEQQLSAIYKNSICVKKVDSVEEAFARYFILGCLDADELYEKLKAQFGSVQGRKAYNMLKTIFKENDIPEALPIRKSRIDIYGFLHRESI